MGRRLEGARQAASGPHLPSGQPQRLAGEQGAGGMANSLQGGDVYLQV